MTECLFTYEVSVISAPRYRIRKHSSNVVVNVVICVVFVLVLLMLFVLVMLFIGR